MHEAMGELRIPSFAMADEAPKYELNEIVSEAKDVTKINPAPSLIIDAGDVDDGITATSGTNTVNLTMAVWNPLLDNIRLFTKIVDGIPDIHLDAIMAFSVLSSVHKRIIAEKDGVDTINRLAESIGDTYAFVHLAEPLKGIASQKSIFMSLTNQTIECAYFISDYVINKDLWKQTVKNLAPNIDNKVKQYQDTLNKLRLAIQDHADTKIPLLTFPMLWDSCVFSDFGPFPRLIQPGNSLGNSTG
ncbi:hypothetical protein JB92DRAFT_2842146 [Gautieria morchelliformis]|nr:hypothetical protein JB92DRAFT_2842146 [Gautieria morchelliformis]